ncbi:MAG: lipocalin family protein [Candidatus Cloacimonetes bacterium]|nr:lipocalin family protein [Candidatus Cloacimonadota bacterium]
MRTLLIMMFVFLALLTVACSTGKSTVKTVSRVDLQRYLGTWYQIAYFPNSFQPADCGLNKAEYMIGANGKLSVLNTCYEDTEGTRIKKQARARAYPVDETNSKLKVSFFWPFKGDYWIVDLDENDYSYSVVSDSKRNNLWILARKPTMERDTFQQLTQRLRDSGFDLSPMVVNVTLQD